MTYLAIPHLMGYLDSFYCCNHATQVHIYSYRRDTWKRNRRFEKKTDINLIIHPLNSL